MKKLLKLIVIFITASMFISCSDNDKDEIQNIDRIVGKWRLSQLFIDNIDQQVNECEKKMTIEVFENGRYIEKDYEYDSALTECISYDLINGSWENLGNSMYKMSGLDVPAIKVTFENNRFIAEYSEEFEGIVFAIKTIFIAEEDVVPDPIVGLWKQDKEFLDEVEIPLTECDKMGDFEFFEDGFFLEREFEEDESSTLCVESTLKIRIWKNIGNSTYILYLITDESEEELKITFENNTMTVELTIEEEGILYNAKLVFSRVI